MSHGRLCRLLVACVVLIACQRWPSDTSSGRDSKESPLPARDAAKRESARMGTTIACNRLREIRVGERVCLSGDAQLTHVELRMCDERVLVSSWRWASFTEDLLSKVREHLFAMCPACRMGTLQDGAVTLLEVCFDVEDSHAAEATPDRPLRGEVKDARDIRLTSIRYAAYSYITPEDEVKRGQIGANL